MKYENYVETEMNGEALERLMGCDLRDLKFKISSGMKGSKREPFLYINAKPISSTWKKVAGMGKMHWEVAMTFAIQEAAKNGQKPAAPPSPTPPPAEAAAEKAEATETAVREPAAPMGITEPLGAPELAVELEEKNPLGTPAKPKSKKKLLVGS